MLKSFTQSCLFMGSYANLWVLIAMWIAADRGEPIPNFSRLGVTPYTCVPFFVLGAIGIVLMARERRRVMLSETQ